LQSSGRALRQRLLAIVRMNRLPRCRAAVVQSAMTGAQPAESDRAVLVKGIEGEADRSTSLVHLLNGDEHVRVRCTVSFEPQSQLHEPGQLSVLREAIVERGSALACVVANLRDGTSRRVREHAAAGIEPQLAILRARQRPL